MLWHTLTPASSREGAFLRLGALLKEVVETGECKKTYTPRAFISHSRELLVLCQSSSTVRCFWSSTLTNSLKYIFLFFWHFLRCVDLFLLTTVKFRMNFCHALRLEGFFSGALEVTLGLSHQCQWVLAAEIMPACLSFSLLLTSLLLSICPLFNGQLFVSADACLSHDAYRAAAASFPSGPIKLQTPVWAQQRKDANLYKGHFLDSSLWLW